MARPKSEDRRAALLAAATKVIAEQGLAAPTACISSNAGVSEGSFFTYFKTKDELVNALYRELRGNLAAAVLADFPADGCVKKRFEHVFTRYVMWGVENHTARRALRNLFVSPAITDASRAEGGVVFAEIERLKADAVVEWNVQDLPSEVAPLTLRALAEMTMDLVEKNPHEAAKYVAIGFRLFWGALSAG